MKLKDRALAALCAAIFVLGLLAGAASAAEDLYFLALNDTLTPLTGDLMPIRANNMVYIPCGVFDRRTAGVTLDVFYGQDKELGTVTLYSREKTLSFDINGGYAYDYPDGKIYAYRALVRNGRAYVPAYSVCQFFGLEYSALSTDYGPLIRIKSEKVWLSDRVFISSAASLMNSRLKEYLQSQTTPSADPSPSPAPPPSGGKSNVRVYIAMRVDSGSQLDALLDFADSLGAPLLLFFRPDDLAAHDDAVRRAAAAGHRIGLLVEGESASEIEEQIALGNLLLEAIALQRTYTLLVPGGDNLRSRMSERGYLCWLENVDGRARRRGSVRLVNDILGQAEAKYSLVRILLEDSISPTALSRLIRKLQADEYNLRPAVETSFGF